MSKLQLGKFSFGTGDRFAHQAKAQLQAVKMAKEKGVDIAPVWNKSYREHKTIGSQVATTRTQADLAVNELGWKGDYFLDADHINLSNVDFFIEYCDFYTIDVAEYIGKPAGVESINAFVIKNEKYIGKLVLPETAATLEVTPALIRSIAEKYLFAAQEAGKIYRYILERKGAGNFVAEVSMDETDDPQTPVEMFFVLAALAQEEIPLATIAPKFSGRFNKGVDYVGDVNQFRTEFVQDILILKLAVKEFGLPDNIKLSVHSGSDKFSIYPAIREAVRKYGAGLHLKTAGTTWLEELIGLAEAGGDGLQLAKEIYARSLEKFDELCAPYATVIDIDKSILPDVTEVNGWNGVKFAETLRHDQKNENYNPGFRQLLHVGYKVAAQMGERYLNALEENEEVIAKNVTENIFERHIKPLFLG